MTASGGWHSMVPYAHITLATCLEFSSSMCSGRTASSAWRRSSRGLLDMQGCQGMPEDNTAQRLVREAWFGAGGVLLVTCQLGTAAEEQEGRGARGGGADTTGGWGCRRRMWRRRRRHRKNEEVEDNGKEPDRWPVAAAHPSLARPQSTEDAPTASSCGVHLRAMSSSWSVSIFSRAFVGRVFGSTCSEGGGAGLRRMRTGARQMWRLCLGGMLDGHQ